MRILVLGIDKMLHAVTSRWQELVFYLKTGSRARLFGKVHLINHNVTCGQGVALYPGVMLVGDGPIVLGDNVSVGNGTILYASKEGGGIYWE